MSRAGWERQALNSIQSVLGHTDPKLASQLAGFSRLASSEEMPAHEKVRSPLRHPPYRRRSRRGNAPYRGRGLQRAAILTWLLTSVTLITVAVILSNGGPAACPMHLESAAVSPGAKGRGLGGHQDAAAWPPGIRLGAGRDRLRPARHPAKRHRLVATGDHRPRQGRQARAAVVAAQSRMI
jgi:hypothetical protein